MIIKLTDLLTIQEPDKYKLHLGCRNIEMKQPLNEYIENPDSWRGWNEWKGKKDDWTKPYIFSLMDFYPISDLWLFGGIFKVIKRYKDRYKLEKMDLFQEYEGRLLIKFRRYQGMRGRSFLLTSYLDKLEVNQILPERYSGQAFCGFDKVCHDFSMLEAIFKNERSDWKSALSSVKGVYLIIDKSNGKKYIGSAYSEGGIWSRWACYIGTGHGWTDELTKIVKDRTIEYAKRNFQFSILEVMSTNVSDPSIIEREKYWKDVLLTREFGYNKN